jgi:lipid-binding SYLF domain-containing protein
MKAMHKPLWLMSALLLTVSVAFADEFEDAKQAFSQAPQSAGFYKDSYGYAIFPTVAKGGLGVGAAHGKGRVYRQGKHVGDTNLTQVSVGLQAGGQAYSEIIFFKDEDAFKRFTAGNFQLGADVNAVAITASAGATANTSSGASASASGTQNAAANAGAWHNGMAVFSLAKGGLMYQAVVNGQKFSFKPNTVASQ